MASHRHERAESTLAREISRILARSIRDPEVTSVRVSRVSLSPDRRAAHIHVAPWDPPERGDPGPGPINALIRATPFIRKSLAKSVRMRRVPELRFSYDLGEQHAKRIDDLLKRIRKRSRKGLSILVAAAGLQFATARAEPALQRIESAAQVMGSEFRIACYAPTLKAAAGAITAAFDEVRRVDSLLSHYKPDSELSRLNEGAARREVTVSSELAGLLQACQKYSEESEGAFDITVGSLVNAWGLHSGDGHVPNKLSLWWARRNSGFRHLRLNRERSTVRFLRTGLRLDPGGIGKGYAVDRAVASLRDRGIERALVSSGTSSIYALGEPPDRPGGWSLDLRAPGLPGESVATVRLKDEALSTSGSYERFFERGGRRYGHILDPRTGRPADGVAAVSVIAPLTLDTEAWSTALFVNGAEWARAHRIPQGKVFLCADGGACGWLYGK